MNKLKMALVAALALPSFHVLAEDAPEAKSDYSVSYNIGLFSQYIFRGYTQTSGDPALQGGVDIEHSSGLYVGAWASNISWLKEDSWQAYKDGGSLELDLYAGYASEFGDTGISYDVGILQYLYPGEVASGYAKANTTEVHVGLGYGWFDTAVHVVTSNDAWTWGNGGFQSDGSEYDSARGTTYYEVNADVPVGELIEHKWLNGVSANFHYGYQHFAGASNNIDSYADWKVGLNKSLADGIDVGYTFTSTDVRQGQGWWVQKYGDYLAKDQHTFYVTKSF
jgi:uncharacterized protein (TIGR02001 family)